VYYFQCFPFVNTSKLTLLFFFWIRGNLISRKVYFVGPGEEVKPQLSQALTRDTRPDSNSRPAVQISNPLSSRYVPWGRKLTLLLMSYTSIDTNIFFFF
jgi:hypothetical protein